MLLAFADTLLFAIAFADTSLFELGECLHVEAYKAHIVFAQQQGSSSAGIGNGAARKKKKKKEKEREGAAPNAGDFASISSSAEALASGGHFLPDFLFQEDDQARLPPLLRTKPLVAMLLTKPLVPRRRPGEAASVKALYITIMSLKTEP